MQIGLGIGIPFTKSQVWLAVQAVFTPAKLFDSGANGLWLDPSDLTTMFQDSAGTTPVTAVEQPVGLILDKSKGLVPGSERIVNGAFDLPFSTGWVNNAAIASIVSDAGNNVLSLSAAGGASNVNQSITGLASKVVQLSFKRRGIATGVGLTGKIQFVDSNLVALGTPMPSVSVVVRADYEQITVKCFVPANAAGIRLLATTTSDDSIGKVYFDDISIKEIPGNHAFQSTSANRPTLSARHNQYVGTEAMATQNVTTLATSYKFTFSGAGSITLSGTATGTYTAGTYTVTCTAGTLTSTVSGSVTQASLVPANQSSLPYQRVNTATDYDSDATKFPWYLKFNGTSSSLQTASINFTATDKMFVSAGVRKLSDAAAGLITELSSAIGSNAGSFYIFAGDAGGGGTPKYATGSRGTTISSTTTTGNYAAPITNVLSGKYSISEDMSILRVNSIQDINNTSDQGTGNYGNYPLYIGARAGTSLFFNGNLYQLVIAGKQASTEEITSTEAYINTKTKAY